MRGLIITPVVLLFTAVLGISVCRAVGADAHIGDSLYASIAALVATVAGIVPLLLARRADQQTVAQAGLVATVLHMFVALALAGAAILVVRLGPPFTYWMFAFYGVTLIIVATEAVRLVRSPRPTAAPKQ